MIAAWEASVRTKGTPLSTFYDNWSKINKIQKRKKITKNDEMADDLPMIKRTKLSEKVEKKVSRNEQEQLELFPSDSEDEPKFGLEDDAEDEAPKAKKDKKKKLKKKKAKAAVQDIEIDDNVKDEPDMVQDFSAADW